jgi:hypothetical protein
MSDVTISVPEKVLTCMYIAMLDAADRLDSGTANLRNCLEFLEKEHTFYPPAHRPMVIDGTMTEKIDLKK